MHAHECAVALRGGLRNAGELPDDHRGGPGRAWLFLSSPVTRHSSLSFFPLENFRQILSVSFHILWTPTLPSRTPPTIPISTTPQAIITSCPSGESTSFRPITR